MMEIKIIDAQHKENINIPDQPFSLFGRMIPSYTDGTWSYGVERFSHETLMCFPEESYDYDAMCKNSIFIGAYDGDICIGLAIMQHAFFEYMYDLKVNEEYRRRGIAKRLLDKAEEIALAEKYIGIYTQGQDNNLGACLFYIQSGFCIGGFDSNNQGTKQEGKADIIFYRDCWTTMQDSCINANSTRAD